MVYVARLNTAMGYVDLHCHLLWNLDDGCRSPEESLAIARALSRLGYTDVAPSPHVQARYASGDVRCAEARLAQAQTLFDQEELGLKLHSSGENQLDERFLARAARGEPRAIGTSPRYVLVELPFLEFVPDVAARAERVVALGLVPLFAHPERCAEFSNAGRIEEVMRCGARFQLNLGSLTGRHGAQARTLAERFLGEERYVAAATDIHNPEGAESWISEAIRRLADRAGEAAVQRLCDENPHRILAGEDIP